MGSLADQIFARAQHAGEVRYGFIEAISGNLASVRMGGTVIEGATWVSRYLPVLGDRVAVMAGDSGLLVLGAVAAQASARSEIGTAFVRGHSSLTYYRWTDTESWDDDLSTPGADPKISEPIEGAEWNWGGGNVLIERDPYRVLGLSLWGGHGRPTEAPVSWDGSITPPPADKVGYVGPRQDAAVMVNNLSLTPDDWQSIWEHIPANAEVLDIAYILRMRRFQPGEPQPEHSGPASFLVHPLHRARFFYGEGWEYEHDPDYYIAHEANLDPIRVQHAYPGDLIVLPIAGDWLAAEESGISAGYIIYPEGEGLVHFSDKYEVVPDGEGGMKRNYLTSDCFSMRVRYTTPLEEN